MDLGSLHFALFPPLGFVLPWCYQVFFFFVCLFVALSAIRVFSTLQCYLPTIGPTTSTANLDGWVSLTVSLRACYISHTANIQYWAWSLASHCSPVIFSIRCTMDCISSRSLKDIWTESSTVPGFRGTHFFARLIDHEQVS